ncbi:hypothetical protein [Rhodopirellula sp. SWK7]|uniref:hypothetical protein n=1 Tax=Rhodopirellula sp. SWK7 TaxID=595460 RepID=UPI0002BFEB31|nr:hypothetical protein [Rhodopirellula sp. SWK7]EMI42921.1 hypothetical protein RRSWK_04560 [Rhodopirellula sp. SWK7]
MEWGVFRRRIMRTDAIVWIAMRVDKDKLGLVDLRPMFPAGIGGLPKYPSKGPESTQR